MAAEWRALTVFPNLTTSPHGGTLNVSLPSSPYCIVGGQDERVKQFAEKNDTFNQLLHSFRDNQSQIYLPSVLIEDQSQRPKDRLRMHAVIAFRNVVAFAHILLNQAKSATSLNPVSPLWSDTFDLFPALVDDNGRVHRITPALSSYFEPMENHLATPSPHLLLQKGNLFRPDVYLVRSLGDLWLKHFRNTSRQSHLSISIFRSLQVAYQAASVSVENQASEFDFGARVALWISSIEILAHPGADGKVNLKRVVDLLSQYRWHSLRLKKRSFKSLHHTVTNRVNAISASYMRMYEARNDYLHGNPVTPRKLLPQISSTRLSLPRIAPIVYRIALAARLQKEYPRDYSTKPGHWSWEYMQFQAYEEALDALISREEPV